MTTTEHTPAPGEIGTIPAVAPGEAPRVLTLEEKVDAIYAFMETLYLDREKIIAGFAPAKENPMLAQVLGQFGLTL